MRLNAIDDYNEAQPAKTEGPDLQRAVLSAIVAKGTTNAEAASVLRTIADFLDPQKNPAVTELRGVDYFGNRKIKFP